MTTKEYNECEWFVPSDCDGTSDMLKCEGEFNYDKPFALAMRPSSEVPYEEREQAFYHYGILPNLSVHPKEFWMGVLYTVQKYERVEQYNHNNWCYMVGKVSIWFEDEEIGCAYTCSLESGNSEEYAAEIVSETRSEAFDDARKRMARDAARIAKIAGLGM